MNKKAEPAYRYKGMPRDSFHPARISDKTRDSNGLSCFSIPNLDLDLAQRRKALAVDGEGKRNNKMVADFTRARKRGKSDAFVYLVRRKIWLVLDLSI